MAIESYVAGNPIAGKLIRGTGGARKLRFQGCGKGKSGGYRTVHYFGGEDIPVFLLDVYGKDTKDDLTQGERNALRAELSALADDYRAGVKRKIAQLRRTS